MLNRRTGGFTIVELLIVIVIIAILAAITIVAFNGVQNRAANSSVQSDVKNNATRIGLFNAEFSRPPTIAELSSNAAVAAKYSTGNAVKIASYCVAGNQYVVGGQSKADQKYYSLNGGSIVNNNAISIANVCAGIGVTKPDGSVADTTITVNNNGLNTTASCAAEGQTCSFSGTKTVAFGANGAFVYRTATTSIACTNAVFGSDPAPGTVKACYVTD